MKKYPEYFVDERRFIIKFFTDDSYSKDYKSAQKYLKKHGGELYTIIGHPSGWAFAKGWHLVNRLGYAVVKWRDLKRLRA
jgi:hypothetical protein